MDFNKLMYAFFLFINIGWLYDITGAYDPTFYTSGAWMIFAGFLLLPVARLINTTEG
jgi:hypothetical protein